MRFGMVLFQPISKGRSRFETQCFQNVFYQIILGRRNPIAAQDNNNLIMKAGE
jgi:hypothetical protein